MKEKKIKKRHLINQTVLLKIEEKGYKHKQTSLPYSVLLGWCRKQKEDRLTKDTNFTIR